MARVLSRESYRCEWANNTYTIHYDDDEIERDVPSYLIAKILSSGLTVYATASEFDYHYYRGRIKGQSKWHVYDSF